MNTTRRVLAVLGLLLALLAPSTHAYAATGTLTADKTSITEGETITFSYTTAEAGAKNWIGIYPEGKLPGEVGSLLWKYTPNTEGTVTLGETNADMTGSLMPGTYKAYLLANDGYEQMAPPVTFTVTEAPSGNPVVDLPTPEQLTVMQLNIWHSASRVDNGLQVVADIIQQNKADVVMLSEAGAATRGIERILDQTGTEYYSFSTGDSGVVSKYPIIETQELDWFGKAVVKAGDEEIAVYSGHLLYNHYANYLPRGYGGGTPAPLPTNEYGWNEIPTGPITDVSVISQINKASGRYLAVQASMDDAAAERAKGRSVLIGGDFNEASHLDWTEAAKDFQDHNGVVMPWDTTVTLEKGGYSDAYRELYPNVLTHPGNTWPSDNPDFPTTDLTWAPKADERDRIDYIFYHPGDALKVQSAAIVGPTTSVVRNQRVEETGQDVFVTPPGVWPTDHKGNVMTFQVMSDEAPVEPVKPTKPTKPVKPVHPVKPEKRRGKPVHPVRPVHPVMPVHPGKPQEKKAA